ncbi:hypothetical protein ACOHYD_08370 [Desulfobacterota bacterium M19]
MEDDNIFDKDDALDYIIYDELSQKDKNKKNGGCLSVLIAFTIPAGSIILWLARHITT